MQYGSEQRHENTEKKNTINGPFTPMPVAFRRSVYAIPAPIPPTIAISAGTDNIALPDGFKINIAPIIAVSRQPI